MGKKSTKKQGAKQRKELCRDTKSQGKSKWTVEETDLRKCRWNVPGIDSLSYRTRNGLNLNKERFHPETRVWKRSLRSFKIRHHGERIVEGYFRSRESGEVYTGRTKTWNLDSTRFYTQLEDKVRQNKDSYNRET